MQSSPAPTGTRHSLAPDSIGHGFNGCQCHPARDDRSRSWYAWMWPRGQGKAVGTALSPADFFNKMLKNVLEMEAGITHSKPGAKA